jgi:eukaryotic-like serine/threonine-protein kinase
MESATSKSNGIEVGLPPFGTEKWDVMRQLFEAAVAQPISERAHFLTEACHGDSALEEQVSALVGVYEHTAATIEFAAVAALSYASQKISSRALQVGEVISNRFEILRYINRGGMGEVYEARDSELKDRVALKTIRQEIASEPAVIERFKEEVRQARGISHPNVCRVYDLFSHEIGPGERLWFLTMELLNGQTLLDRLRQQKSVDSREALEIIEQIVAGLSAAHERGIVHRDFKSSNVMLVPNGSRTRAVITDFGLALNTRNTQNDLGRHGTPAYMAPEQELSLPIGTAADQYALGIVICEMLTGLRPKRSEPSNSIDGLKLTLPNQKLLGHWEPIIRRCLQNNPQDRFQSVSEIMTVLHPKLRRRMQLRALGLATSVLMIAGLAVLLSLPSRMRLEGSTQLTPSTQRLPTSLGFIPRWLVMPRLKAISSARSNSTLPKVRRAASGSGHTLHRKGVCERNSKELCLLPGIFL